MDEPPLDWPGVLEPALLSKNLAAGHKLADAADGGDWPAFFDLLDATPALSANQWRPGSPEWFTPLHQAARHGVPPKVVAALTERGALRSLRDARAWTACDVATEAGHPAALISLLAPPPSPLSAELTRALDANLQWVIDGSIRAAQLFEDHSDHELRKLLRYPPVAVLHEAPGHSVRFAIPGMSGGFRVTLRCGYLETVSGTPSDRKLHVITDRGAVPISEGPR
ncbi:ankyrin repeat domain-containing protein [[Mycobacterium] nativiensis]|uniref:Ankyrin repeat domain-containing protein n=1 Tax=[Mycobacterium] nativiensis TaxID=2855503 RepID=A0ABU5XYM4_9MYCO|nr:ankyrin repeat domain-containing protein [Mycolicibacter sp. MYC340]MEB3032571.1 ankyrin repeat domain-containing protein [Mycolicibacter sp. MYC340]